MQTKYTYKQIWLIAYPILISLLMEQMIGMTDTAFLGRVGEVELGASAIAGVFYMVIFMVAFGFSIGAQILIARRNGERQYKEIGDLFYQGINSYTQQITSELLALKLNHPDLPHCNCPKCGAETIIVFNKVAKCSDPNCGFLLFRTFNGRELTDNQMLLLLSGKRTGYLKFTSKKGKKYEASLELDDNYRIEMTFKDNKPKK